MAPAHPQPQHWPKFCPSCHFTQLGITSAFRPTDIDVEVSLRLFEKKKARIDKNGVKNTFKVVVQASKDGQKLPNLSIFPFADSVNRHDGHTVAILHRDIGVAMVCWSVSRM